MGDFMRAKRIFAGGVVVCVTLLLALAPAGAGQDTSQADKHRRAGAAAHAARPAAPGHRHAGTQQASSLPRLVGSARADVPALRGRLGVAHDRHAALGQRRVCRDRHGRRTGCGPAMSWTRGLDPAAGVQAEECPDGTLATPARGHENIIRCMPI